MPHPFQDGCQPSRSSLDNNNNIIPKKVAQAWLLSRSAALVGTLTSNYMGVVFEMASAQCGTAPPELIDLDGNAYFPCSVNEAPPWGAEHGLSKMRHGPRLVAAAPDVKEPQVKT